MKKERCGNPDVGCGKFLFLTYYIMFCFMDVMNLIKSRYWILDILQVINFHFTLETPDCIADKEAEEASEYLSRRRRSLNRQKRWEVVSGRTWQSGDFK